MCIQVELDIYIVKSCDTLEALDDRRLDCGQFGSLCAIGSTLQGHFLKPLSHHLFVRCCIQAIHITHLTVKLHQFRRFLFPLLSPQASGSIVRDQWQQRFFSIPYLILQCRRNHGNFLCIDHRGLAFCASQLTLPCDRRSANSSRSTDRNRKLRLQFNHTAHIVTLIQCVILRNTRAAHSIKSCQKCADSNGGSIQKRRFTASIIANDHSQFMVERCFKALEATEIFDFDAVNLHG